MFLEDDRSNYGSKSLFSMKMEEILPETLRGVYITLSSPTEVLSVAAVEGDLEPAEVAIAYDADVNAVHPVFELPIIHVVAGHGFRNIAEAILKTERCDLTVRDRLGRLASDCAALCAHDYELADRLAEVQAAQFRSSGKDPRRATMPNYGSFRYEP